jgi:hypothetical protein
VQKECLCVVCSLNSIYSNSNLQFISGIFYAMSENCEDIPCYLLASSSKFGAVSSFPVL